jgi:hypothetical protein
VSCINIRGNRAARLCIDGVWVLVKQAPAYPLSRSDVPHYGGGITACDRWALSLPHRNAVTNFLYAVSGADSASGSCTVDGSQRTPVCSRCLQLDDSAPERESDGVGPITRA